MHALRRIAFAVVVLTGLVALPVLAEMMDCPHPMDATLPALHDCVQHALDMGHIDNSGIAHALLAKVASAQAAVDGGRPGTAIQLLQAFIHQVHAQSGKHIDAAHAEHMAMHAQMVIDALAS